MLGDATEEPCDKPAGNSGLSQSALFKQLYDVVAQYNIGLADSRKGQQTGLTDVELLVRSHLHEMCPKVPLPTCPVELKIEYDDKEEEVPEQKINKEQVETMVKKMIHEKAKQESQKYKNEFMYQGQKHAYQPIREESGALSTVQREAQEQRRSAAKQSRAGDEDECKRREEDEWINVKTNIRAPQQNPMGTKMIFSQDKQVIYDAASAFLQLSEW